MGLLDAFLNPTPEQRSGLLAAAASLAKTSGPSLVPISGAQGLSSALQAYEHGVQSYQDRQQQQTLMGLKIKDAQSDFDNQELIRERNKRIAQRLQGLQLPQGVPKLGDTAGADAAGGDSRFSGLMNPDGLTPASHMGGSVFTAAAARAGLPGDMSTLNSIVGLVNQGQDPLQAALSIAGKTSKPGITDTPQTMASALPGGPMSPKMGGPDWLQAYQQQNGLQLPAQPTARGANFSTQGAAPAPNLTQDLIARLTREAQIRSEEGDLEGANKLYEHAVKFMPEVNKIEVGLDGDKPVNVITFKDGTQRVSPYAPKPAIHFADDGQNTAIPVSEYTGLAMGPGLKRYQTPDSKAVDVRAAADRAAGGDVTTAFSPDAIRNAAARYNIDGTLPPMGMGKAGAQARVAILNEAANQKSGVSGDQQRWDQLNNKGDVAARNAAVRSFATGKDGQAVQAANTALNHLDTIRQLATAQKNNDWTTFNRVSRAIGAQFGQTAPTDMKAALIMVAPEISKAVVGVNGTGHERDQAIDALNPNNSLDQIISGTGVMQELFGGRLTEAKRTYERTTKLSDFDSTMLSPAAQKVLARAQQHANPTGGGAAPPAGGQFSVQAPNGKTFYFKNAKDMNNFKITAGIR